MARAAPPLVTAAWTGLGVHPLELRLENTLENGQCFGWRRQPGDSSEPVWVGVLGEHVLALRQTEDDCMFRCVGGPAVAATDAVAAAAPVPPEVGAARFAPVAVPYDRPLTLRRHRLRGGRRR